MKKHLLHLLALLWLTLGTAPASAQDGGAELELVGTVPADTRVPALGLRATHEVWREMIDGARESLDIAQFYVSVKPGGRLDPIIRAVEQAAARGVRVRLLADSKFHRTYPETLDALGARRGIELRLIDLTEPNDGVLHAKYFVVDGRQAFLGSPNFDWRALEHIQELGVRTNSQAVVRPLLDVFEHDWAFAKGERPPQPGRYELTGTADFAGREHRVTPVFSPRGLLPDDRRWDLPRLLELIDGAQRRVRIQLLSYKAAYRDGRYFGQLEAALRRAAARGVEVQLLLSHWCTRPGTIEGLQSLQCLPGIDVTLVTIPQHESGFIPFGRVVHSKYMVVDGLHAWIGTSNGSGDYFYSSRNVGVLVDGKAFAAKLDEYFEAGWNGPYAERVDPGKEYEAPRVGR